MLRLSSGQSSTVRQGTLEEMERQLRCLAFGVCRPATPVSDDSAKGASHPAESFRASAAGLCAPQLQLQITWLLTKSFTGQPQLVQAAAASFLRG